MRKRILACVAASAMVLSLTACDSGSVNSNNVSTKKSNVDKEVGVEQTAKPGKPPENAKIGGTFVVRVASGALSPDMIDGFSANGSNTGLIRLMEGYGLTVLNRERELIWDDVVVKEHEEKDNEDGSKTFTITIQDNLKWSDGSEITAKDYLFAFMGRSSKQYAEIEGDATAGSQLVGYTDFNSGKSSEFKGLHLIDDYTFSMQVDAENLPNYYILGDIGALPYPMKAIAPGVDIVDEGNGAKFTDEFTTDLLRKTMLDPDKGFRYKRPVVCGPYKLSKVDMSSETVELTINEEYLGLYDGTKPHIKTIITKPVPDETYVDEFAKGTLDFYLTANGEKIDSTLTKLENKEIEANYGIVPLDQVDEWRFACDFGPSQFEEVRRAFAYILDRDEMNKQLSGGHATIVDCLATEAMTDYQAVKDELESEITHYSYDIDKAKKELVDGGWTLNESGGNFEEGKDEVRYKKVGDELMPLIIKWAYRESESSTLYNTMVPPEAEKIGMKLEGTKMDFSQIINHLNREGVDPTYNVFTVGVTLPELSSWWYFFDNAPERMGLWNYYRVDDIELKEVTQKMKEVTPGDTEAFRKYFVEFQKLFNKKLPGVVISSGTQYWFYNPKLKNFVPRAYDNWWYAVLDAYIED